MSRYQAYAEYKDSGVEWLGQIPDHWTCTQIKHGYEIALGKMLQKEQKRPDEQFKPYLKTANIQPLGLELDNVESMWFSDLEMKYLKLEIGDILISEGGDVGRAALWMGELPECYIQNAINRARPRKTRSSRFFLYWMSMLKGSDYIDVLCNKATIAHYTVEKLATTPLFLPIDYEAEAIANFLDHETAKIDLLIEKQQALIELLKEKRQAVISHAVTKGLNPNAPMKDSGVEWLGEVPAHWDKIKIKYALHNLIDAEHKTADYFDDGEYLVCRTTNVRDGNLQLEGGKYTNLETYTEWIRRGKPEAGDILFTREAPTGEACIVPEEPLLCLGQRMVLFKLNKDRMNSKFVLYSIYSGMADDFIKQLSQGSTVSHMNMADIVNIPLFEPPYEEQVAIERYLDQQKSKYDFLEQKAEQQIQLFQERRTALISAAVTGKIDVRDWQKPAQA